MATERVIVIGASAGGLVALRSLVSRLRADLAAPVLIAMHVAHDHRSLLPGILTRAGELPAREAEDGEPLARGRVYVAKPGCHMLIQDHKICLSNGPKENGFRPSIDVLFRSAAYHLGPAVIGVVLSGSLDDGSSGLYAIKRMGGTAVVQDPAEAEYGSMPLSALSRVAIDHKLSAEAIGALLNELAVQAPASKTANADQYRKQLQADVAISANDSAFKMGIMDYGQPTRYTCPSCFGVLFKIDEGESQRFRCHTGHGFSLASLLEEQRAHIEDRLWQGLESLQENIALLTATASRLRELGEHGPAEEFERKIVEANELADKLRGLALDEVRSDAPAE